MILVCAWLGVDLEPAAGLGLILNPPGFGLVWTCFRLWEFGVVLAGVKAKPCGWQCPVVWRWGWWSRTGGVAACREQVGAGEEAEASPFGELGEHVAGVDAELVCEFAAAPGSARVVFHERSDDFSSGWGRIRVAQFAVSGAPGVVEAGRVHDDLDAGDGGRQVGPLVVAVEVSGCGVLKPACAPAGSAGWKERGQDGATDGTEEVGLAGLARLIGGEDLVGCDELVASGLQKRW